MSFPLSNDKAPDVAKTDVKKDVVPMEFPGPSDVRLVQANGSVLVFKPGVQMVPAELANHPWLKAHKVRFIAGLEGKQAVATAKAQDEAVEEEAKKKTEDDKKSSEDAAKVERDKALTALSAMTKAELAVYAKQKYKLDLTVDDMKKDEMITAIIEAMKERDDAARKG